MRNLFLVVVLLLFSTNLKAQVLWLEDFTLPDGTTSDAGATAWTSSYSGSGYFATASNTFFVYDLDSEGVWTSESIDISSYGYAVIDVAGYIYFAGTGDYLRFYYSVDGGPETIFGNFSDGFFTGAVGASTIVSGSSLTVIVRAFNNGFFDTYEFDDVTVTGITTLYSRKNGNWNDVTAGNGTWSTVSHVGASCDCAPNTLTRAIIGNGNTVSMNADGTTAGIELSSGTLQYTNTGVDLNISRGYWSQQAGGTVNRNGQSDSRINFTSAAITTATVNGAITVDDIAITAAATLTLTGSGSIAVSDDFYIGADDATITNNISGGFSVGDRIEFQTGITDAIFTNNQTLTATTLLFDDDNNTFNNNMSLTLSGNVAVNNNTDDGNDVNNNAGAVLTFVNVDAGTGGGGDLSINNSGTINQSGPFNNIPSNTNAANSVNNLSGATYNFGGATGTNVRLFCNNGTNTFNYNRAGDQSIITPQDAYSNLSISTSGTKTPSATIDVNGNLIIQNSAVLNMFNVSNRDLNLFGNWTVTGTASFTEASGRVTFDGTADQTIRNTNGETFFNVTVNKGGGTLILDQTNSTDVTITGTLTLTQGIVITTTNELLVINNGATTTGGDADSYVDGPMRKVGNSPDPYIFPTGDGAVWARIQMDYGTGAGSTTQFDAQYFGSAYPDLSNDATFNHASAVEYWTLDRTNTAAQGTVRLFWESGTRSQINNLTCCDLIVARYNGTDWTDVGRTATSGTTTAGSVTSANVTTFSPFTFGSESALGNPLPITLTDFTARLIGDEVDLRWITAQEINNDFFTIEKSADIEHFEEVGRVDGQGDSQEQKTYRLIDYAPYTGRSYYRLKQTDFDGTFTYSKVVTVDYNGPKDAVLIAYPNPFNGKEINIELKGLKGATAVPVQIYDQRGRMVYHQVLREMAPGYFREKALFHEDLAPGIYIIKAGPTLMLTRKIVVN
ncbi:MAG: T9SS type A sorting domain-containing protein [Bacteroidota bacterium]